MSDASAPLRVLVLCTANMCRSPLAAAIIGLDAGDLCERGLLVVESAGIRVEPGEAMCPASADFAGLDPRAHAAREVTAELLDAAGLVLAMDRTHRAAAARLAPACRPRMFTLRQAAAVAAAVAETVGAGALPDGAPPLPTTTADRLAWLVAEMDAARGTRSGVPQEDDDIVDLHGPQPHPQVFGQVAEAATALAEAMRRLSVP